MQTLVTFYLCFVLNAHYVLPNPLNDPILGDAFQGDILLPPGKNLAENFLNSGTEAWPNGRVPYVIQSNTYTQNDINIILAGMALIERQTNVGYEYVKFFPRTNEATYLQIYSGEGCQSYVGKLKSAGPQLLSLRRSSANGLACMFIGTVAHELIHALGFFHTQNRPDRDKYIRVLYENIQTGRTSEFNIFTGKDTLGLPYDATSIMHYGRFAFSKDRTSPTIESLQAGVVLKDSYEKTALTDIDVQGIRILYDSNNLNNNNNNNNDNNNNNIFNSSYSLESNSYLLFISFITFFFAFIKTFLI